MVLFRQGEINHCPGCGGTQWNVGRNSAECAYEKCGLPLDFANRPTTGRAEIRSQNLHIPENRPPQPGTPTIFRQNYHIPTRRSLQDDFYAHA